jgi:ligand-binding sensor domain-containing protein
MKNYQFYRLVYLLLPAILFFNACNGQVNSGTNTNTVNELKADKPEHAKLIKTQGTGEYDIVSCSFHDKAGNHWFGTSGEGVYRYNGKTFAQFTVADGLSNNNVWCILEDKSGMIWFGTTDGPCYYDGTKIVRVPINVNFLPDTNSNNYYTATSTKKTVWSMLIDKKGTHWFGTGEGVYCYDGRLFTRFLDNPSIINKDNLHLKMIACMLEDKNGVMWFGSGMPPGMEGICRYDGKILEHFTPQNQKWIRSMSEDSTGKLFFATRIKGVCTYDGTAFTFPGNPPGMPADLVNGGLKDRAGNTWFACDYGEDVNDTAGGVWRYDGNRFTKFSTAQGLINNSAFFVFEDRDGKIWVGTRNMGLYRLDGERFTSFSE